jgi:hypothetical protein
MKQFGMAELTVARKEPKEKRRKVSFLCNFAFHALLNSSHMITISTVRPS